MKKEQAFVQQFLSDVYRHQNGDITLVNRLSPFSCKVAPIMLLSSEQIDFSKELFFSVGSYKPGAVEKTGKGRSKSNLQAVGVLHFDLDFDRKFNPAEYVKSKGLPEPSYVFKRAGRAQVYYLLNEQCTDFQKYEKILKYWVKKLKADDLPAQAAALMRVPYCAHIKKGVKGPGYVPVLVTRKRYPLESFSSPEIEGKSPYNTHSPTGVSSSTRPVSGLENTPLYRNILLKERSKITTGAGRSGALYQFGLRCRDFALEERDALEVAHKFNALYCDPPEPDSVVNHQVASAYKYAKHPPGRYLSEKPEKVALKFEADSKIAESLLDFVYIAEAEMLINTVTGLRYTKDSQIEKALGYATGQKSPLLYVLTNRLINQKDRLAFRPDEEAEFTRAGVSFFNTYEKIKTIEKTKTRKSDVKVFEDHLKYLSNTQEEFEHLRKYLASVLLRPGRKIKHAVLIVSTYEGIGKSILQILAEKILKSERDNSYVITTSNTEIVRGHNSWIESKFLTFVHELGQSEKFAVLDQIKNWITEPSVRISDKYIRSYEIDNHCNFFFFTNAVNALPIGGNDRRFFIIVNRKKPMPAVYYDRLLETFEHGLSSIVGYLEQYADALNVNAAPPVTDSKIEMRQYSVNELTIFLDECLRDPELKSFWDKPFTVRNIADRLADSMKSSNVKFSQKQVAIWLRENNFHQERNSHARLYVKDNVIRKENKFKKEAKK